MTCDNSIWNLGGGGRSRRGRKNHLLRRQRQVDICKIEASLVYKGSSRTVGLLIRGGGGGGREGGIGRGGSSVEDEENEEEEKEKKEEEEREDKEE